jgi:hypothetical protein
MQETAVRLLDAATVSDPPHCCRRTLAAPTSAMADKRQSTRASEWPLDFGNARCFRGDPNDGKGSIPDLQEQVESLFTEQSTGQRCARPKWRGDGRVHSDVAPDAALRKEIQLESTLEGDANLLILPKIAYNLLKTAAGNNIAIGPILLGAAQPVHLLTALLVADAGALPEQGAVEG